MIRFESGGILLEEPHELPPIPQKVRRLTADFETSSGHPRAVATNPWRNCQAIGAAVQMDDSPVWFVPKCLLVTGWWRDLLRATDEWENHNVKYDMHVSKNDLCVDPPGHVSCTLTGAKLIDSDRIYRGGYGLDVLSRDWLDKMIGQYEYAMGPYLADSKDYGDVPVDILAEYACVDVQATRAVGDFIRSKMPEESMGVWVTEQAVTSLLYQIEQRGVRVDPHQLKLTYVEVLKRLLDLDERLDEMTGRSFRAGVNADCYDVLCVQYGLPILAWTEPQPRKDGTLGTPGPSFDAEALELYRNHPDAPSELIETMCEYRSLDTFKNLFLSKWDELHDGRGVMHPTYNQALRTARMSCSEPNMQQLNEMAKRLIVPPEGYAIVQADFSQIEFRFIAHYIGNPQWVGAYNADPWTDAHQWMAERAECDRGPAKTINFMMGYGGGKKKTVATLSMNKRIMEKVLAEIDGLGLVGEERSTAIRAACQDRGEALYDTYHRILPELKPTARRAASVCASRGYVRNHYGRRRHLPQKASHNAFNSICQSSAGDLMKERMLALDRDVPEFEQIAQVHDQVVGVVPLELVERDDALLERITQILNDPDRPLSVPIRTGIGWSAKNWADAEEDDRERRFW